MKKLLVFALVLMAALALSACGGEVTFPEDTDGSAAEEVLDLNGNGYKVVYDVTDPNAISIMTEMIGKIEQSNGFKLSGSNSGNPEGEYEIQFGLKSGRSEAESLYGEISGYTDSGTAAYSIRAVGKKIVIAASDKDALKVAADRFAKIVSYSESSVFSAEYDETAVFDISEYQRGNLKVVYADEFLANCDLASISVCGKPVQSFSADKTRYYIASEGNALLNVRNVKADAISAIPDFAGAKVEVSVTVDYPDVYRSYDYDIEINVTAADGVSGKRYVLSIIETKPLNVYDIETWLTPYWEGGIVYHESIMFVGDDGAPLLYTPEHVLSVRSFDLKTEYVEGVDYEVKDGKIYRLANSAMPHFTWDEFYPKSKETSVSGNAFAGAQEPFVMFAEGTYFHTHQVFVTYKHNGNSDIYVPQVSTKLNKFIDKLERGEEVNLVFFGDSITAGANASGRGGVLPGTPMWTEMVSNALKAKYPKAKINYTNTAVGGKETNWGIAELDGRVNAYKPDLLVLGFGMNDGGKATDKFVANVKTIVDGVLAANPDCEIAVIGTMLPHKETTYYTGQYLQEAALGAMVKSYSNVDIIPMTSVHSHLLKSKRYFDMTGNNVNHPNDFLIRAYAQTVLEVIVGGIK